MEGKIERERKGKQTCGLLEKVEMKIEERKLGFAKLFGSDPWSWRRVFGQSAASERGKFL